VDQAGLSADELEQLRRWGAGLQQDSRLEVSAAGRAIVLLIDEIERLHVLVWDHRLYPPTATICPSRSHSASGSAFVHKPSPRTEAVSTS
jgi:hypothetical protein